MSVKKIDNSCYYLKKFAFIGGEGVGKTTFITKIIQYINNFHYTKDYEGALSSKEDKLIYEGDNISLEQVEELKEAGFKVVLIEREGLEVPLLSEYRGIADIVVYNRFDLDKFYQNAFKFIEQHIYPFILIKKYQNPKTMEVKERVFFITRHALQRFKQRYSKLKETADLDTQFWRELEDREEMLDKFKVAFRRSCKFNEDKKYLRRRKKHQHNTEYFTDRVFTFVVINNVIVTSEVSIKDLRFVNKG